MEGLLEAERRLVRLGIVAGAIAAATYLGDKFLPFPAALSRAFFMYNGFFILLAIIGLFPFMRRPRITASALLGLVFGVVTSVMRMVFSVVQIANVERFGRIANDGASSVSLRRGRCARWPRPNRPVRAASARGFSATQSMTIGAGAGCSPPF